MQHAEFLLLSLAQFRKKVKIMHTFLIALMMIVAFNFSGCSDHAVQKGERQNNAAIQAIDPLPSWNEGKSKQAITGFVKDVTVKGSPHFVASAERIAVFDNDGTLWSEQPIYVQVAFILDRVKMLAPKHPEWQHQQPFKAVLEGDLKAVTAGGKKAFIELLLATHAGSSTAEFTQIVKTWIATARDPKTGKLYVNRVYQPMLELLEYLRTNGFKTYIVSGGGIEFMRPWTEKVYGVPPEQVIGSSIKTQFEMHNGTPVLMRLPEIDFIDNKDGKPVAINLHIGRRPILAFGNSDGDLQMLQWTTAGNGARFGGLVHHTDAQREYAYDRNSAIGRLDKALDEAPARGWTVVDMKLDWKTIYRD
jgi:haloacid dehalogenase-like hydrolase